MSIESDIVHEVNQSLGRCYQHGAFLDKFCSNFKAANVAIPPFVGRQARLLKEDLTRLVMSADGSRSGAVANPHHLNVHPQLSKYWIDALIATVRECDDKFTPELERKWRIVLHEGIQSMGRVRLPA